MQGAAVYIDNALAGKVPMKSEALKSGQHTVRIVKEMYEPYSTTVTVNDNETTTVTPNLIADFANVTLRVDADAEIWVNGERKGVRSWTGDLASGTYKMECRLENHEPSMVKKEITNQMNGEVIQLESPRPILGSLVVESNPDMATLYIDGKPMGETPKLIKEILVGRHEIKLTKQGCADYTELVTITKGERKQVTATLSTGKEIQFTCNVPNATLEIDGQKMNSANGTYMLTYGQHSLRAMAADYREYTYTINVNESSRNHSIQMQALVKDEETFTVKGVSFTMKLVEGGTFQMGATSEQGSEAESDEKPVHSVTLSNYYIGETEVTQALWQAVMGSNPSYFKGDNLPVENVSWNDCQEFIRKLNQKTGKNFRLPTEAEWEYAARGGKKSRGYKYSGGNTLGSVAWYGDNSGNKTHTVKTKSPNELGLYDMSGNVWEWCQDWYGNYNSGSQTNPQGPSSGSSRALRGGGWDNIAWSCRVSSRYINYPGIRFYYYGFRLALPE
jgi:formylglycine-generating enzyme required for sulfatase activity